MDEYENTKIYLVRHAQSQANHKKRSTGWTDVDLSELGIEQATITRPYFSKIKLDNIYSSTLKRAHRTAQIIFGEDAQINQLDEFKELMLGDFDMKMHEELIAEYPDLYRNWINDPTLATPPNGENIYDYYGRVTSGLTRVIGENIGKTAAIVAHGGVIRCFVLYTLNMKLNDIWKIKVDNVSISVIEFSGSKKALTLLNDTCHLAGQKKEAI